MMECPALSDLRTTSKKHTSNSTGSVICEIASMKRLNAPTGTVKNMPRDCDERYCVPGHSHDGPGHCYCVPGI